MFTYGTQIQLLAKLVLCHSLAVSHYTPVQRQMSWSKVQEFCQKHYVDLAVLNTEEQYFTLFNATAAKKFSFWLGLRRQSISSNWRWVNGKELSYDHWYRRNYEGHCASLEAMLKTDKKLLGRYCDELHMFVCQGPVSPQPVTVGSVGSDHVNLSWNVSAVMRMTTHSYNVMTCADTCDTLLYPYLNGSTSMSISIPNLTSATEYSIHITAVVDRPDNSTGGKTILQSNAATLQFKTANPEGHDRVIVIFVKVLKLVTLAPLVWVLYCILKNGKSLTLDDVESDHVVSPVELTADDIIVDLIPRKTRGTG